MSEAQTEALLERMRSMSAADLSVLEAAIKQPSGEQPVLLTTIPGSANDQLWSEMTKLGWLSAEPPLAVPVQSKVFALQPSAKPALEELFAELNRPEAMTKLLNELRAEYPPKLIEAVHRAHGTPVDLAMMLAAIVEMTMRRSIKKELHEEFLNEVIRMVQSMRAF